MEIYINGSSCISNANTFDENYFFEDSSATPASNHLLAKEPDYKNYIQPVNRLRRMSHIVKMGVTTSLQAIGKEEGEKIDAVVVGTGIGCFEDTDKFLRSLIENDEELLTPTSFIQSTHNTVSGQIALLIKCFGYNFTYVHQNLSFEYALLDAMMLINEKEASNIIVGGIDESNASLLELYSRAGHIKKESELEPVWTAKNKGYAIGEGSAFFKVSAEKTASCLAKIKGVKCFQSINAAEELLEKTNSFLSEIGVAKEEVQLLLSGNCGDAAMDAKITDFNTKMNLPLAYFKNVCGEYFTSSAFAVWMASQIIKKQEVPKAISPVSIEIPLIKNILIVNHYQDQLYSLICISKC